MIAGATQADVALLVVPASTGEFEGAFENSGQTKEHTLLIRSLGVAQLIVAVNKMDTIAWDPIRYQNIVDSLKSYLQRVGFRKQIHFVPVSGMHGTNLSSLDGICAWYDGPTLLQAIGETHFLIPYFSFLISSFPHILIPQFLNPSISNSSKQMSSLLLNAQFRNLFEWESQTSPSRLRSGNACQDVSILEPWRLAARFVAFSHYFIQCRLICFLVDADARRSHFSRQRFGIEKMAIWSSYTLF